jgi:hypothetical protein
LLYGSSDQPERTPGKGCNQCVTAELRTQSVAVSIARQAAAFSSVLLQMGFTRSKVTSAPRGLLHHGSILACAA